MKNSLGRFVPEGFIPFKGADTLIKNMKRVLVPEVTTRETDKVIRTLSDLFDLIPITDGMTLSFHHHLRNGDGVLNMVLSEIKKMSKKDNL